MTQPFGKEGWTPNLLDSQKRKTYLITGANTGAGFQATRLLLAKGASVVMLNRNLEKSTVAIEKLKTEFGTAVNVQVIQMDLAELDSVRQATGRILRDVPDIDALICNAAIAQVATHQLTVDGFESQLGVNHFGHFLLCGLLFERIQESKGRIVVVGSNAYKMGKKRIVFEDLNFESKYSAWDAYAQSKLAQMMFGYELQRRLKAIDSPVQVHVCHPGAAKTNLLMDTANWFMKYLWIVLSQFIAQSAEKGAYPEVMCATAEGLQSETLYGPTKSADTVGPVGVCGLDTVALDREMGSQLWAVSEQKVGFQWSV